MMCVILTLLGVVVAGFAVLPWFVMRIMAIARSDGDGRATDEVDLEIYPLFPDISRLDSTAGDVTQRKVFVRCPRCGHECGICFKGMPVEPVEMYHCNECGWVGPPSEESDLGFHNHEGE